MSHDSIEYAAVLTDLEVRRNVLNSRVSNIDSAIGAISALLEEGAVRPAPLVSQAAVPVAAEQPAPKVSTIRAGYVAAWHPEAVAETAENGEVTERRKRSSSLNVYVNQFPDWSRGMTKAKVVARKQNGIRCPKCSSIDTRQSVTRGFSDYFMFLFDYTNARCRNCNARFRVWRPQPVQTSRGEVREREKLIS